MVTQFRNPIMRGAASGAFALLCMAATLFAFAGGAAAQSIPIVSVEAQPDTVTVPVTRSAPMSITYVFTNETGEPVTAINSPQVEFSFSAENGSGTLPLSVPIVRTVNLQPGQSIRIREPAVIPQSFLLRALQAGTRNISGIRGFLFQFGNGQTATSSVDIAVNLTGGLGTELQVNRIDLRFQNEAVQIIVPQNHPPEVRADIGYTGTGVLRAVWELADPRATAAGGNPIFRTLRQDRVRLGVGGFTRVKGPALPARLTGLHIVRFRVLDGPLKGQATVVRYFVKKATPDGEDWWKRYIRPHSEGEGLVRVPAEPEDADELTVETAPEEEAPPAAPDEETSPEGETPPEDDAAPEDGASPEDDTEDEAEPGDEPSGEDTEGSSGG